MGDSPHSYAAMVPKSTIEHRACYNTYMKEFASVVHWGIEQKTSGKLLYN